MLNAFISGGWLYLKKYNYTCLGITDFNIINQTLGIKLCAQKEQLTIYLYTREVQQNIFKV